MKNGLLYLISLSVLTACGNQGSSLSAPPAELVGTWVADGSESITTFEKAGVIKPEAPVAIDEADECYGLAADDDGIDAGVMRITASGQVARALRVKGTRDPYVRIGTVYTNSKFSPTSGTEKQYIQNFDGFLSPGASLAPLIHFRYFDDLQKGPTIEMEIQVSVVSTTGFYVSPVTQRRYFRKISEGLEKFHLNKASLCAEKLQLLGTDGSEI